MKKIFIVLIICVASLLGNTCEALGDKVIQGRNSEVKIPYEIGCENKKGGCLEAGLTDAIRNTNINDSYTTGNAVDYVQRIVIYLLGFLYFIGVVIIIYAGFMILTANGDEEKVSKAKKIILYVVIGFVVIFLAGPIMDFIIEMFNRSSK